MLVQHKYCSGWSWWWQQTDYSSFSNDLCSPRPGRAFARTVVAAHWKFSEEERKCCLMAGFGRSSLKFGSCWSWVARWPASLVTSVAEWNLSFWNLYWIDKRSNELPALEDLGVCCVYFFFIFFILFGLKPIPRSLVFPQTGNPVSLASCDCSAACLPHCCTFLSWTVVFIWKWKKLKCRCVSLALAHSSFCPLLSK